MKKYLFMLLGGGVIVGLDQWTKALTVAHIACTPYTLDGQLTSCAQAAALPRTLPALEGVFHLTHFHNTGMAFSLLEGGRWLFLALTAAVLALAAVAVVKGWLSHPLALAAVVCIAGGGVGNLIDRAVSGAVVDMIELDFMRFAIFNVADCFVCIGAGLLALWALFFDKKKEAKDDRPV